MTTQALQAAKNYLFVLFDMCCSPFKTSHKKCVHEVKVARENFSSALNDLTKRRNGKKNGATDPDLHNRRTKL